MTYGNLTKSLCPKCKKQAQIFSYIEYIYLKSKTIKMSSSLVKMHNSFLILRKPIVILLFPQYEHSYAICDINESPLIRDAQIEQMSKCVVKPSVSFSGNNEMMSLRPITSNQVSQSWQILAWYFLSNCTYLVALNLI